MRARMSVPCLASVAVAALSLVACGSLLGLNELEKVDCLKNCGGSSSGATSASGGDPAVSSGGSSGTGTDGGTASGGVSGTIASGGTSNGGHSSLTGGSAGTTGGTGGAGATQICPGGDEPPLTWTEHWYEHNQVLNRVYFDDCVAIYFDTDMDASAVNWIAPFITSAWEYSLKTYGTMGPQRAFSVFHMGRYGGGHAGYYYESLHDFRNTTDGGQDSWPDKSYDLPAHLLGFLVENTATHTKYGSPAGALWGDEGFADLYKFDLYTGLGMTAEASAAQTAFNAVTSDSPNANTYWFRDWFYPIWKGYGHAAPFARFFGLLQQYYPADANGNMASMNWGEYVHFMSGAAGKNLQPLAQTAFGWPADWETQFQKAQADYPELTY